MLEETVDRILPLFPFDKILTIANSDQTATIRKLLPDIPEENLLIEPQGKNTSPSLMLATAWVYLQNPKAVLLALPADHLIKDPSLFLKLAKAGASAAAEKEALITFGISPTYPATGYGYIHFSKENSLSYDGEPFYRVQEFKEKPEHEQAQIFLEDGNYLWNSGMFLWQAEVFAKKLKKYAPMFYPYWKRMLDALERNNKHKMDVIFDEIQKISIDYALMEKAEGVLVCPGDFGWSDVGAWSSLSEIWPQDNDGNVSKGDLMVVDSQKNISYNPDKLTVLIGVKDLVVVNTKDALLICHKDKDQKVKEVVNLIEKKEQK